MVRQSRLTTFPKCTSAVVTGGGGGIGAAVVDALGAHGVQVAVWDRDYPTARATADGAAAKGVRSTAVAVDVTRADMVEEAWATTYDRLGEVSMVVNNAAPGFGSGVSFVAGVVATVDSVRLVTETWLREYADDRHDNRVVNVVSLAGIYLGGPGPAWYSAAKGAVAGYTMHMAASPDHRVRVNAVAPTVVLTPRTADSVKTPQGLARIRRIPLRRAADPSDVANVVLFLLSDGAAYLNGVIIPVDGGEHLVPE